MDKRTFLKTSALAGLGGLTAFNSIARGNPVNNSMKILQDFSPIYEKWRVYTAAFALRL